MFTTEDIDHIRVATADAYSCDRYGEAAWDKAIILLGEEGHTAEDVEWILHSKYMRWAADEFDAAGLDGSEIIRYEAQWGIVIGG